MHLVCPACTTVNRIAPGRLMDRPKCGRCRHELLDGHPVTLTEAAFSRYIENNDLPIVVDFWAGWCGPCKAMVPVFSQLAGELRAKVCFGKVDVDAEPGLAARFGVRSIPTLILFGQGKEIDRVAGAMNAANLRTWLLSRSGPIR